MKSLLYLVTGVLIVDVLWAKGELKPCSEYSHDVCRPKDMEEFRKNPNLFPDEAMLDRHCDGFLASFKCLEDYEKRCFAEAGSIFGGSGSSEAVHSLVKNICDKDSSIGKGYRNHVDCFNTNADNINMCYRNNSQLDNRFREYLVREYDDMTEDDYDKVECIVVEMTKTCLEDTVKKTCGQEASRAATEILNQFGSPLRGPLCASVNLVQVKERFGTFLVQDAEREARNAQDAEREAIHLQDAKREPRRRKRSNQCTGCRWRKP